MNFLQNKRNALFCSRFSNERNLKVPLKSTYIRSITPRVRKPIISPSFPEWATQLFNYRSWAPRAARRWRFKEYYIEGKEKGKEEGEKEKERIGDSDYIFDVQKQIDILDRLQMQVDEMKRIEKEKEEDKIQKYFDRSSSFSPQKSQPLESLSFSSFSSAPLTGDELIEMILDRYGVRYDIIFARRDIFGKSFLSLNIMWQYLEQRSFPMNEEQYIDKMNGIANTINSFGLSEVERVRGYFEDSGEKESKNTKKTKKTKRPKVGSALSIRLQVNQELIDEYF